jgi:putative transposase
LMVGRPSPQSPSISRLTSPPDQILSKCRRSRHQIPTPLATAPAAMAKKKRHSRVEIASKLAQANDLATQGKLQSEIARTLGVSVMTLHRWRKAPPGPQPAFVATHDTGPSDRTPAGGNRIAELQLENARLRRLVTDLLLEKIKLEEAAQSQKSPSDGRKRASR